MGKRINFVVDDDIPEIMTRLAGGERKRGEWLTGLIRDIEAGKIIKVGEVIDSGTFSQEELANAIRDMQDVHEMRNELEEIKVRLNELLSSGRVVSENGEELHGL